MGRRRHSNVATGTPPLLLLCSLAVVRLVVSRKRPCRASSKASDVKSQQDGPTTSTAADASTQCRLSRAASLTPRELQQACEPEALQRSPSLLKLTLSAVGAALGAQLSCLAQLAYTVRFIFAVVESSANRMATDFDLSPMEALHATNVASGTPAEGVQDAAPAEPAAPREINRWLAGSWRLSKTIEVFPGQPSAADILKLGGVARTGMRMFKGMEFGLSGDRLFMTALTKVPFIKVSQEQYRFDGSISVHNRRDMRKGRCLGHIEILPNGDVDMLYQWDDPCAGVGRDEIRLCGKDELRITTHLDVGGVRGAYCVVYSRTREAKAGRSGSTASAALSTPAGSLPAVPSLARMNEFESKSGRAQLVI